VISFLAIGGADVALVVSVMARVLFLILRVAHYRRDWHRSKK
jgi:hypothetical protein